MMRIESQVASSDTPSHEQPESPRRPRHPDPLVLALARYVEALHARYPEGPAQMRREALDGRSIITRMSDLGKGRRA